MPHATQNKPDAGSSMDGANEHPSGVPALDSLAASQIGARLRESYQKIVEEAVPNRFVDLLAQLEQSEKSAGDK